MELPRNDFKAALHGEAIQYGCWAGLANGYASEILATSGFDWMLLDGEHGPNTVPTLLAQLQAVAGYPVAPVVRCVNHDPSLIKQLLDIGTQTLMVPMVETEAQARALVAAMRYPPHGKRGVGGGLVRATSGGVRGFPAAGTGAGHDLPLESVLADRRSEPAAGSSSGAPHHSGRVADRPARADSTGARDPDIDPTRCEHFSLNARNTV